MTALIQVLDSLKLAVDQKQYSVAKFIDLRKAFDIINHHILLASLTKYGFGEIEANWICSYLTDRQYVVFNGVHSHLCPCVIRCPSRFCTRILAVLFAFQSNSTHFISFSPFLYADDIETHCSHSNLGVAQTQINNDLKRVDQWIADNRMKANVKKTKNYGYWITASTEKKQIKLKSIWTIRSLMWLLHFTISVFELAIFWHGNIILAEYTFHHFTPHL